MLLDERDKRRCSTNITDKIPEKMVNYLEYARALAECSPLSSVNALPTQQRKPEKFSKVNFIGKPYTVHS